MKFDGMWKTRCGFTVVLGEERKKVILGTVSIPMEGQAISVPSYWNKITGDSPVKEFDLVEKISGPGIFGQRGVN